MRSATSMNLDAWKVAYGSLSPHENGATNLGCVAAPKTFAPAPSTVPVVSIVPMPVLTWSPNMVPRNCCPVSTIPAGVHRCTVPYVFFRLLVVVPAPRFTHRPRYECPTKPVCPLLECPSTIVELISPRILHLSPIEQLATRSPTIVVSVPMQHGPTTRVNAEIVAPLRMRIGPAVASNITYDSIDAPRSMAT